MTVAELIAQLQRHVQHDEVRIFSRSSGEIYYIDDLDEPENSQVLVFINVKEDQP